MHPLLEQSPEHLEELSEKMGRYLGATHAYRCREGSARPSRWDDVYEDVKVQLITEAVEAGIPRDWLLGVIREKEARPC